MNTSISQNEVNIGVDTGKYQLDIYVRPLDIAFSVQNNPDGIKAAIQELKKLKPARIVIEATGRLEQPFCWPAQKPNCLSRS